MIEKAAGVATYGGASSAIIFGLRADEWTVVGVIAGILIGLAGLGVTYYFKHRTFKLNEKKLALFDDE